MSSGISRSAWIHSGESRGRRVHSGSRGFALSHLGVVDVRVGSLGRRYGSCSHGFTQAHLVGFSPYSRGFTQERLVVVGFIRVRVG